MENIPETLIGVGYLFFLASVTPNMVTIWKNRNRLRGFSRWGVWATAAGLSLTQTAFSLEKAYIPVLIGMPNFVYWLILSFLVWRNDS